MTNFEIIIPFVITNEGGDKLSKDPYDPGNWTGGEVNSGILKGSKFGISAAQYPNIDFNNFSQDQAEAIYLTDYWNKLNGENLPIAIGFLVMDAGVNSGMETAIEWLQTTLGFTGNNIDGNCGPVTQKAVNNYVSGQEDLCLQFSINHLMAVTQFSNWTLYKHEYIKRAFGNTVIASKLFTG